MTAPDSDAPAPAPAPLHPEFARRLKLAGVGQDGAYYAARWAGVTAYADEVGVAKVLDLVRLTAGEVLPGDRPAGFRDALRGTDPGFAEGDNALEMSILAGFVLAHLWRAPGADEEPAADVAALALLTWDFRGRAAGTTAAAFVADAATYRTRRASAVAAAPPTVIAVVGKSPVSGKQVTDAATAAAQSGQVVTLASLVGQVAAAAEALFKQQRALAASADAALRAQREEADVAWWVLGEHSRDLGVHVEALPAAAAPLILGKELGDLAGQLPGTLAAPAVLDRMLRAHRAGSPSAAVRTGAPAKSARANGGPNGRGGRATTPPAFPAPGDGDVPLHAAVAAAPSAWRERWANVLGGTIHGSLTPVLTAVEASLGTEADDEWVPVFRKAAGFDPRDATFARPALLLAEQAYDESVLARALATALRR